jgi:hypothetical protein
MSEPDTAENVVVNAMELIEFLITGVNDECLYPCGLELQKALIHLAQAHDALIDQDKQGVVIQLDRP